VTAYGAFFWLGGGGGGERAMNTLWCSFDKYSHVTEPTGSSCLSFLV
jgi:hypothetical protein